jgi:hypothetical protein
MMAIRPPGKAPLHHRGAVRRSLAPADVPMMTPAAQKRSMSRSANPSTRPISQARPTWPPPPSASVRNL